MDVDADRGSRQMSSKKGKSRRPAVQENRRGMVLILFVVVLLSSVLIIQCRRLEAKNDAYAQEVKSLNEQITEEEGRSEKIEAYREYVKSDAYVEKTAREKFGLVYPDEVIFRESE